MQQQILTSNSNNFHYIDRFDDIMKIALALKAQLYYADSITNKIFGFYEEGYSIIETEVPFKITNSVFFSGTSLQKDIINFHKTFFYVDEYPFYLFPENRRADFMNNNILFDWEYTSFRDKMTGALLDDCILSYEPDSWFKFPKYMSLIKAYNNRLFTLDKPIVFENIQNNNVIIKTMSNKVSQGCNILALNSDHKSFVFYVFKSLLGPVTKADNLTLYIQPDKLETNKFMATFEVYKKKTKLEVPGLNDMRIQTHVFILNLV